MKAIEQYFHVVLFIMLYTVVLILKFVDETLLCDHSNESYWAVLSCGTVYYAVHGCSNFEVCGWNPSVWPFKWKLLSNTFMWYCLLCSLVTFFLWGDQIYLFCKTAVALRRGLSNETKYIIFSVYVKSVNESLVRNHKSKLLSSSFMWCCLLYCTRWL